MKRRLHKGPSRFVAALLVTAGTVAALVGLALVLDPTSAVSSAAVIEPDVQGTLRVQGAGIAKIPAPEDSNITVPACTVSIDAKATGDTKEDPLPATGTFHCEMSAKAVALGVPFSDLDGAAVEFRSLEPSVGGDRDRLTIAGTATLTLADGSTQEDVGYSALVQEGRVGRGSLVLRVEGFDGEPGDVKPGNGRYDMARQTLTEGRIQITFDPKPSPTPSNSESPTPTPSTPTPSESPSPSSSPSVTPTQTSTFTPVIPPPGDPFGGGGGGGPPINPDIGPPPYSVGGPWSSATLMAVLSHLSSTGSPKESDILSVAGSFPVAGLAWWQNDWHAYRCCPYPHVHTGVDMFAETGTPLVAVADGTVTQRAENPISGLGVEIQDAAGTQYFYAHLSAFASGLSVGQAVKTGQVIGYVGNTGNAAGTSPHLHFEVQPNGLPVPPIPYVNKWLGEAESRAFLLLEEDFSFAITPADLAKWQELAAQLAGNATPGSEGSPYGATGAGGSDGTNVAGLAGLDGNDPIRMAVGPMVFFVAMAYLFLLITPGVRAGRRDALSTIVAETRSESAEKPVVSPA